MPVPIFKWGKLYYNCGKEARSMEEYRVLLVDDEEDIRVGISRKMDWTALGFTLVGEAGNGEEALEDLAAVAPPCWPCWI